MQPSFRRERVSELLRSFLAEELRHSKDPRLQLITVTEVEVTPDLKEARVFWRVISLPPRDEGRSAAQQVTSEEEIKQGGRALDHARGYLQHRIAEELDLRYIPKLTFHFDSSSDQGMRIDHLFEALAHGRAPAEPNKLTEEEGT